MENNNPTDGMSDDVTSIILNDTSYSLNSDGDALNIDGTIFKTKLELDDMNNSTPNSNEPNDDTPTDEPNTIDSIIKTVGIEILDEEGKTVSYEDSIEGTTQYIADVYNQGAMDKGTEVLTELFTTYPILDTVIKHLDLYGNLDRLVNGNDYTVNQFDENDTQQHQSLIAESLFEKGHSESEVKELIEFYTSKGTLKDRAKESFEYLKTVQNENEATINASREADKLEVERVNNEYLSTVKSIITKGDLTLGDNNVIHIPDVLKVKDENGRILNKTKGDFIKFITEPIQVQIDGKVVTMTENQYRNELRERSENENHHILTALRNFTNDDNSQLIKKQIDVAKTNNLKLKFASATTSKSTPIPNGNKDGVVSFNLPTK